jgi:hypothetical protein
LEILCVLFTLDTKEEVADSSSPLLCTLMHMLEMKRPVWQYKCENETPKLKITEAPEQP